MIRSKGWRPIALSASSTLEASTGEWPISVSACSSTTPTAGSSSMHRIVGIRWHPALPDGIEARDSGSDLGPGAGLHNGWLKRGANLADSRDVVTREEPMRISNQMLQ